LDGHKERVIALAFSPNGRTLYTGAFDLTVRFWDVATRKEMRCIGKAKTDFSANDPLIQSLIVAPDGKSIAAGRQDGSIAIWNTATGKELRKWNADQLPVMSLSYSPDSKVLASATWHGIRLWDPETGKRLDPFVEAQGWARWFALSPNGKVLAAACDNQTLRVLEVESRKELASITLAPMSLGGLTFSPDSRTLAFLTAPFFATPPVEHRIRLLDVATGRDKGDLVKQTEMIRFIAFSPLGDTMAGWGANDFFLWDARSGKELRRFRGPQNAVAAFGYSPDGRLLATAGQGDTNVLWDPVAGKKIREFGRREYWNDGFLAFSPDGKTMAMVGGQWRKDQGSQDATEIILRETATGQERCRLVGHQHQLKAAAFSPDGRVIASAAAGEESIRLWDALMGKQIGELTGHRGWVDCLAFTPDGLTLISSSVDTTILFWDMGRIAIQEKQVVARLDDKRVLALCGDLANPDAAHAYRAMGALIQHADQATPLLKASLEKVAVGTLPPGLISGLISDLDDNNFAVREKAFTELAKLGYLAEPALRKALDGKTSQEAQYRLKMLLEKLKDTTSDPMRIRVLRELEVLERIGSPQAQTVLHDLQIANKGLVSEEAKASLERLAKRAGGTR
jgi:WD40 repeat protein